MDSGRHVTQLVIDSNQTLRPMRGFTWSGTHLRYEPLYCVQRYGHILQQDARKLKVAECKLAELRKKLKKAHMPEALLQEVDCALALIETRLAGV